MSTVFYFIISHVMLTDEPVLCFWLVLPAQSAFAGFDEAASAFAAGDYDTALAEVLPLAEQVDPRSQYGMGVLYENGFAVTKDPLQAASWYRKAAEQGDIDALSNLGVPYQNGQGVVQDKVLALALYNGLGGLRRRKNNKSVTESYDPGQPNAA